MNGLNNERWAGTGGKKAGKGDYEQFAAES
jgi:hypothetical protein